MSPWRDLLGVRVDHERVLHLQDELGKGNKSPWLLLPVQGKVTRGSLALSQGSLQHEEMWELWPQTPIPEQICWFRVENNEQEPFGGVWKEQEEAGTGGKAQEKPSVIRAWPGPPRPHSLLLRLPPLQPQLLGSSWPWS